MSIDSRTLSILFAAGGTGGHLFPAIAIAEEIKKTRPDARIAFVGTKNKIEARVVPERGFEFYKIWISGFHRRLTVDNLLFPVKIVVSLAQSFFLIRKFGPNVVVGTGGYVCGPILYIASLMRIPTVVHESLEAAAPKNLPRGVGAMSWVILSREILDWSRFKNRRQVASYTGLCPGVHTSDGRGREGSINRCGNPRVRCALLELMWRMVHFQPGYKPVQLLRDKAALSPRRRRKVAVAAARHLAIDLWRLATGQTTAQKLGLNAPFTV